MGQLGRARVGIERSLPPEPDEDDAARVRAIEDQHLRLVMRALQKVSMLPGSSDKRFRNQVCDPDADIGRLTERQREHVRRLAWRYRRQMPAHLAPKFNPDDPLIRELGLG